MKLRYAETFVPMRRQYLLNFDFRSVALPSPHRTTHAVARRSPSATTRLSEETILKAVLFASTEKSVTVLPRFLGKA